MRAASAGSGPVLAERSPPGGAADLPHGGTADLGLRIASALVLAPLGLAALAAGSWLWKLLIILCVAGAAHEWGGITRRTRPARPALVAASAAVAALGAEGAWSAAFGLLAALSAACLLARRWGFGPAAASGLLYASIPGLALIWLRGLRATSAWPSGFHLVLLLLLTVWASDTGAYAAGRAIGGPKLAPSLSPKKTWAGAAGGLAAAVATGLVFAIVVAPGELIGFAGLAGLLGIAAQAGDLLESAAKRRFGVKDSGQLIPGHGGLLDRMDGLMAAAPVAALLVIAG